MRNLILISILLSLLTACGPQEKSSRQRVRAANANVHGQVSTEGFVDRCTNGQAAVGSIYDDPALGLGAVSFKDRIGALISATMDPAMFGEIDGQYGSTATGVDLRINLKKTNNQQIDLQQSRMQIQIFDSHVGQPSSSGGTIQPYPITLTSASRAVLNETTKQFEVEFGDQYGTLKFVGTWNETQAWGTVHFQNRTHFSGGTPLQGTVGAFAFPACALFQ